jgi:hypothetical protein
MKKLSIYIALVFTVSVMLTSCSKEDSNEVTNGSAASVTTDEGMTSKAPATITCFPQEETFYNECCGEEVTLNYTVCVIENANGYRAVLTQLSGTGSSGSTYVGANTQGAMGGPNNLTYTFSTTLVSSAGCVFRMSQQYHVTVVDGSPVVEFDHFSFDCH